METWRLLVTPDLPGATNMAMDVAIANFVRLGDSLPTIRFYNWKPYCLSLGYHQELTNVNLQACRDNHIDVVKRTTGGRAVYHAQELTYSVIIPYGSQLYGESILETFFLIAEWLLDGFSEYGIKADLAPRKDVSQRKNAFQNDSCFSSASGYEVLVQGRKLVGSAQRRWPNVVLQHGSILVGDEHQKIANLLNVSMDKQEEMLLYLKNKTICMKELIPSVPDLDDFSEIMASIWARRFDVNLLPGEVSDPEWKEIQVRQKEFELFTPSFMTP